MNPISYRSVADVALEGARLHLELIRFTRYSQLFIPAEMFATVEQFLHIAQTNQGDRRRIYFLKKRLAKYKKTILF